MFNSKVSVIMPCYNSEKTVEQAIRGVVNQTYRPIEFILVNDGSTDASDAVIKSLEQKITDSNIEFKYIIQENKGLGGAINTGLKYVTGEYIAWPDSDDELLPLSVEKRVNFLKNHKDFGSVSSNAVSFRNINGKDEIIDLVTKNIDWNSEENQFVNLLTGKSMFCPGCHLVKKDVFKKSHGGMEIYPARHGQNWQMLLPVYYCSKHGFINEALYKYRTGEISMSTKVNQMPLKDFYKRQNEYLEIVKKTLDQIKIMSKSERKKYLNIFKKCIYEGNLERAILKEDKKYAFIWKVMIKYMILKNK